MNTTKLVLILLVAILVSAGGGYAFGKSGTRQDTNVGEEQISTSVPADQEDNPYDGSNLTLVKMYDNLQNASGDEFDRRLMVYLMAMNLNQTGMLRQVDSKSQKADFKELARIQIEQNDKVLELLRGWQKEWGYTDH